MERKKDAKASTAAIRTCQGKQEFAQRAQNTHRGFAVSKSALEGRHDDIFMLLLDDLWCGGEYPERVLALCGILRLAGLEQGSQQFWPCNACASFRPGRRSHVRKWRGLPTFVCVLTRKLGHGVSDLCAYRRVRFVGETLEELCAYGFSLGGVERQEQVGRLA